MAITVNIGAAATDRSWRFYQASLDYVLIEGSTPATKSGHVTTVALWINEDIGSPGGVTLGTFYKTNGNSFTCRDYEVVDTAGGYEEFATNLTVVVGDYIGILLTAGRPLEHDTTGGTEYWYVQRSTITLSNTACTYTASAINSIGGEISEGSAEGAIVTLACTNTTGYSSTGNGLITDLGGSTVTQHGHCWDTSTNPTTALDTKTTLGVAPQLTHFSSSITGLTAGTTYYVRAYITNTSGTEYGVNVTIGTGSTIGRRHLWIEGTELHYFDEYGTERKIEGLAITSGFPWWHFFR